MGLREATMVRKEGPREDHTVWAPKSGTGLAMCDCEAWGKQWASPSELQFLIYKTDATTCISVLFGA